MESGPAKPDHSLNLLLKMQAIERMEKLGNYWIGPDIPMTQKVILPPLRLSRGVNITVNKSHLPPIEITRGTLSAMRWSVRSCHAQSGTDVIFHHANLSDEMIENIREGKDVPIPVDMMNALDRPVELEGDIMRFFWVNDRNRLRQKDLREVVGKELVLEGEEGKDWYLGDSLVGIDKEKYPEESKDLCIVLPLKEKYHILPAQETLKVNSKKDLPGILIKISEEETPYFSVGETTSVKLGENIVAVLVVRGYDQGMHLYSPLIDPKFEGPIRTETLFGLKEVDMYIYKK